MGEIQVVEQNGLFWQSLINAATGRKVKPKAPKAEPPYPFWLEDNYLPFLNQARKMTGQQRMTGADWKLAKDKGHTFGWDTECYWDYWAFGVRNRKTKKIDYVELVPGGELDYNKIHYIINNFELYGFNSDRYDATMLALALSGCDNGVLKECSDAMIVGGVHYIEILKKYNVHRLNFFSHIDLQEVAPGKESLKTYGARLGVNWLQDLPFPPGRVLGPDRRLIVRYYMGNDTELTCALADALEGDVQLRGTMTRRYGLDLRSSSEPNIAESLLKSMYERRTGIRATRTQVAPGTVYRYNIPSYMKFRTPQMQGVLNTLRTLDFVVGESGHISLPSELKREKIAFKSPTRYTFGIGGIHSTEKGQTIFAGPDEELEDADVTSFYPWMILNQGLYPKHLGRELLETYREVLETRVKAKASGDKVTNEALKIVLNSSFGKFGNKWSVLYSPDFVIQTTISGQLNLLMLAEALEEVGIRVVSANTDGIVSLCPKHLIATKKKIYEWWMKTTRLNLEYTSYVSIHSASVNDYYAVKQLHNKDGSDMVDERGNLKRECKRKGIYAGDSLKTTPNMNICSDAVEQYLLHGTDLADTIYACTDVKKFVTVQNIKTKSGDVNGGVWGDTYLGKVVRFYWSNAEDRNRIIVAANGNKVPNSDNCRPMMTWVDAIPDDLDYEAYVAAAKKILIDIGL